MSECLDRTSRLLPSTLRNGCAKQVAYGLAVVRTPNGFCQNATNVNDFEFG